MNNGMTRVNRREMLRCAALGTAAGFLGLDVLASPTSALTAKKGTINFADIGVGDPGGDWTKFSAAAGWDVNLVAVGNAPSQIINVLVASGGKQVYDVVNIVGGMQKPLVDNGLILPIDTSRLTNWGKDSYIRNFLAPGKPGFEFIGYKGQLYGRPTV